MKILICKDTLINKLLETRALNESDNIKYEIIDNAPVIEEREHEMGHYELDEKGELIVVYEAIPPTIEEKMAEQEKLIADLMFEIAMMQGGALNE